MGSNLNFSSFGNQPSGDGGGGNGGGGNRSPGNFPLARQTSVYSLTFDEFQSSLGKDFGSMNMDELLRNIWSAEETQGVAPPTVAGGSSATGAGVGGLEGLQRQGSLTLPRTLSQRTVDEVWKDLAKEYTLGKNVINSGEGSNMPQTQRQQTLGEMTLEEFLVRAGVVREETQLAGKVNNGGFLGNNNNGNTGLVIGFQQPSPKVSTLTGNRGPDSLNQISIQSSHSPMNANGGRSSNQHPIFPKQPNFGYGTQMSLQGTNAQLGSPRMRNGIVETGDQGLVQSSMLPVGSLGLACSVATQSPMAPFSPDEIGRNNGDVSSVSPVPYMFGGVVRGRKRSGAVEKVVERRQKRMIKNRESAARSRARKQAYTTELEAEVAKLKEENEELQRRQAEIMELQKNQQVMEMMNATGGPKKRLRRTQTGPW